MLKVLKHIPIANLFRNTSLIVFLSFFSFHSNGQVEYKNIKTDFGATGKGLKSDHEAFRKAARYINQRKGNVVLFIPKGTYLVGQRILKPLHIVNIKWEDENIFVPDSIDAFSLKHVKNVKITGEKGTVIKIQEAIKFGAFDPVTGNIPDEFSLKPSVSHELLLKGFELLRPPYGFKLLSPSYKVVNNGLSLIKRDTLTNAFSGITGKQGYQHIYNQFAYSFSGIYHLVKDGKLDSAFISFEPVFVLPQNNTVEISPGAVFRFTDCTDIAIENIFLDGNSRKHILGGSYNATVPTGYEMHSPAIFAGDCTGLSFKKTTVDDFGTIGLHIKNNNKKLDAKDQRILIENCNFKKNGWANFYVSGGSGIRIINSRFDSCGFAAKRKIVTPPGAGLGFEDETGSGVNNVYIDKCSSLYNMGAAFNNAYENDSNFLVKNSSFHSYTSYSLIAAKESRFYNCKFYSPLNYYNSNLADRGKIIFSNCLFTDRINTNQPASSQHTPFLFAAGLIRSELLIDSCTFISYNSYFDYIPATLPGKVVISNCHFSQFHTKTNYAYAYMNGVRLMNNKFKMVVSENNKAYIRMLEKEKKVLVEKLKKK